MVGVHLADQPVDVNRQPKLLDNSPELIRLHVAGFVGIPPQRDERVDCAERREAASVNKAFVASLCRL